MKAFALIAILLVALVFISGCASTGSIAENNKDISQPNVPEGGPPLPPVETCDNSVQESCESESSV